MTDTVHTEVVFSDMHNRKAVVRNLMEKIGLLKDDVRQPGFRTTQLGDRLSLGYGEQETDFYEWVDGLIDVQLVGNHEYPSVGPKAQTMMFSGYEERDIVAEQMLRRDFNHARMSLDPDKWVAASNIGPWLIVHAGLTPAAQKELGAGQTAAEYAVILNELWIDHVTNGTIEPIFLDTRQQGNGIFWVRLPYLRAGYRDSHVPQIVGHTGYDANQKWAPPSLQNRDKNIWGLDTPGSCAALVTTDNGENLTLVESDYYVRYDENRLQGNVYRVDTDELI